MARDEKENEALMKRTDALLKKHRPRTGPNFAGSPAPTLDIPVLTEVVSADAVKTPAAAQADADALTARLHEDVLRGLQPQINALLDARLKQTLADLLEQVLHGLEAELKVALRAMVRDAVAAAIDREIIRLAQAQNVVPASVAPAPPKPPVKR